jgi:hypothetical protein
MHDEAERRAGREAQKLLNVYAKSFQKSVGRRAWLSSPTCVCASAVAFFIEMYLYLVMKGLTDGPGKPTHDPST